MDEKYEKAIDVLTKMSKPFKKNDELEREKAILLLDGLAFETETRLGYLLYGGKYEIMDKKII